LPSLCFLFFALFAVTFVVVLTLSEVEGEESLYFAFCCCSLFAKLKEKAFHINHLQNIFVAFLNKSGVKSPNPVNTRKQYRFPSHKSFLRPSIIELER
jgi:hypothetical protein